MKKRIFRARDICLSVLILLLSFFISLLFQHVFDVQEHITTVFVFGVFLISLLTEGYACGIAAAIVGTAAVNYAFTFPYFSPSVTLPVNLISAAVMIVVALLTGALTTKLKRHEALKAESEKERMRANLLRAVSHDLRTPLTTIYGSATTLLEHPDSLTEEQKHRMIGGIKEEAEWLVQMVENLLSVTRIDAGQVQIIRTPTVLEELIDSVLLKFKKRYPDRTVALSLPEDIVVIPMDAILIEQVILNMLENAIRHADGMTALSLRVFLRDGRAVFEITDDGCGIPPEQMARIFDGHYNPTEEPADGQKKKGGIGLSVCATIVKAHGGEIEAENGKDGGAVFRFTLDTEDVDGDQ